ncbi:hypothetical protein PHAVU_005G177700 [Phaseolus vulgaris]|uniref:Epidermal patterning factor-like protein n=1 Tax=Phaseolus vulgaris TaxID=3885 RepID=V7BXV3_PHAVU|nr:hypothetical protein PHAVU_005G177700g [Phaseolus vulgaris]ESW22744.1 hypothetical protein PHAVU_005G177700g [Phaseolus vulgaris]
MAPQGSRTYKLHGLQLALILTFFLFLIVLLPHSGGSVLSDRRKSLEEEKVGIGSKPPACGNKCMNCRPCTATVVVPDHKNKKKGFMEDDNYYLLSWKCRCGDKFFQP